MPGLNVDILGQLTSTIDERQSSAGRAGGQPLLLLTAPRAGYGKTHLLGRLAAAAGGQVVLVPLAFRLEDEIGISAVAAALEVKLDCPAVEPVAIKREIPAILRDESLAA